ncbi:hypothetical protein ACN4EK_25565 [Pantanalinema rosaneae CENA516]|uniref:hypothetical protein n=1 Tax=Pantanalinema rosaneae TaxID=1620701 RepID=UPI003D6DC542
MNYSPSPELSTLTAKHLYYQYVETLSDRQSLFNFQNATIRYFIPSLDGPVPAAQKRRPLSTEDIQVGLNFLDQVSLDTLRHAPDLVLKTAEKLGSSTVQKERVRRSLSNFIDWAVQHDYLAPLDNPIPEGICHHISVGLYAALPLKRASARQICQAYLAQATDTSEATTNTQNAIVRFFIPGCGGPRPLHKPAREFEVQAALSYLETVPLEYLDAAVTIATAVMQALHISQTQQTRMRRTLQDLLRWARRWHYLPQPHSVTPWGTPTAFPICPSDPAKTQTLKDYYERYSQHLQSAHLTAGLDLWQSALVHYFIPACGGPAPVHERLTQADVQAAIDYLDTLRLPYLMNAQTLLNLELERLQLTPAQQTEIRMHLHGWVDWICHQLGITYSSDNAAPEPVFNTFRTPGSARPRQKPGAQMQAKRCCDYALCAKKFPNDYINPKLQQQLQDYQQWRLDNNVNPGGYVVEAEQILQVLGWLHRYENVALEDLCFEQFITKSPLTIQAANYDDYLEYLRQKDMVIQRARTVADEDLARVERYLKFVGGHPASQSRRIFIALAIGKFLYRKDRNQDDFPSDRNIPILRRLLDLQSTKKEEATQALPTVAFSETSVTWAEVIQAMKHQRQRADQTITHVRTDTTQGFTSCQRPNTGLANDLQRFLSIIFCILVPSRSRTFYELRIGETFKEGILTQQRFRSVENLKHQGLWETSHQEVKFYFHHTPKDFKTGKSMAPTMRQSEGWWVELPNVPFGSLTLYDYIRRWLDWGRTVRGEVEHDFFFRRCFSTEPMRASDWNSRIKTIIRGRTEVPVPPRNLRKIFATQFAGLSESSAVLLQHSEDMENLHYDMRDTVQKIAPVMTANLQFIQEVLSEVSPADAAQSTGNDASDAD